VRVAIVTGRRAAQLLREYVERLRRSGVDAELHVVPIEVAALIPKHVLAEHLKALRGSVDVVVVPGTLEYDVKDLEESLGIRIVRGPRDPSVFAVAATLGAEAFWKLVEAGEFSLEPLLDIPLEELRQQHAKAKGMDICGVKVPLRPPPLVVVSEVYVRKGAEANSVAAKVVDALSRGADMVVLGFGSEWSANEIAGMVRAVHRVVEVPLGLDAASDKAHAELVKSGHVCLSLTGHAANKLVEALPSGAAVVIAPVGPGYYVPSSVDERVKLLEALYSLATRRGLKVVVDPMVDPPGSGLMPTSVAAYVEAARMFPDAPLLAGIANVYELIDADSHGQIPVLVQLFAEAGASMLLVTEESSKAAKAVTEAVIAATMTSISLLRSMPPKDLGVDLIYVKEKRKVPSAAKAPRAVQEYDTRSLAVWHVFAYDEEGSHMLWVEEDGSIVDLYIGRKGTILLKGRSAEEIYKSVAYLRLASRPEHYMYIGYELCKAETASILGRSYVQDLPLMVPPHYRCKVYSPRLRKVIQLGRETKKKNQG
jgi:dihydropteroate synthase-like protein